MLSGVPQGTVLGPCLFLLYINDLPESLSSNVRLFADYTIQVQTPSCILQSVLEKLAQWEQMWDMKFHPDNSSQYDYILHGPESLVQLVDEQVAVEEDGWMVIAID